MKAMNSWCRSRASSPRRSTASPANRMKTGRRCAGKLCRRGDGKAWPAPRANSLDMEMRSDGQTRLHYRIPSRGLFGYRTEFLTDTRGTGIMHHVPRIRPCAGEVTHRSRGVIISMNQGSSTGVCHRRTAGTLRPALGPGVEVYEGMIVGEEFARKSTWWSISPN